MFAPGPANITASLSLQVTPRQKRASVSYHFHSCSHPSPNLECCTRKWKEGRGEHGIARSEIVVASRRISPASVGLLQCWWSCHTWNRGHLWHVHLCNLTCFGTCIHSPHQHTLHIGGTRKHRVQHDCRVRKQKFTTQTRTDSHALTHSQAIVFRRAH